MVLSGAWRTVAACSTQLTCRFTYMATKQKSWPTCCFNLEMLRLICRVGNKLANNKSCRTCWTTLRTSSTTSCQLVLANKLSNKLAKWNLALTQINKQTHNAISQLGLCLRGCRAGKHYRRNLLAARVVTSSVVYSKPQCGAIPTVVGNRRPVDGAI